MALPLSNIAGAVDLVSNPGGGRADKPRVGVDAYSLASSCEVGCTKGALVPSPYNESSAPSETRASTVLVASASEGRSSSMKQTC